MPSAGISSCGKRHVPASNAASSACTRRASWTPPSSPRGTSHWGDSPQGPSPGVVYEASGKQIFVLPGVPLELKAIFTEELEPEFLSEGSAATVREIRFTFAVEARFYPLMKELEQSYPDVSVGSYPNFETKELVIRCLGADPKRVDAVIELVRRRSAELGMAGNLI